MRPEDWTYAYSKYLAEREVQKAVARGLDVVIVNPTYVLGPEMSTGAAVHWLYGQPGIHYLEWSKVD